MNMVDSIGLTMLLLLLLLLLLSSLPFSQIYCRSLFLHDFKHPGEAHTDLNAHGGGGGGGGGVMMIPSSSPALGSVEESKLFLISMYVYMYVCMYVCLFVCIFPPQIHTILP